MKFRVLSFPLLAGTLGGVFEEASGLRAKVGKADEGNGPAAAAAG
jgi:hypothetical protein